MYSAQIPDHQFVSIDNDKYVGAWVCVGVHMHVLSCV